MVALYAQAYPRPLLVCMYVVVSMVGMVTKSPNVGTVTKNGVYKCIFNERWIPDLENQV